MRNLHSTRILVLLSTAALAAAACAPESADDFREAESQLPPTACTGSVKEYNKATEGVTRIVDIQQKQAGKKVPVPVPSFGKQAFSRPVPRVISQAHDYFPEDSPITGYPHEGWDYSGIGNQQASDIEGQPIHAITAGTVVFTLNSCEAGDAVWCGDGWGNHVVIDHGSTPTEHVYSRYAHMEQGSVQVKVGQTVNTGQQIGQVGMTGYTAGPHLHLEIGTLDNRAVDPCKPTTFDRVYDPLPYLDPVDTLEPRLIKAPPASGGAPVAEKPPVTNKGTKPDLTVKRCAVNNIDGDGFTVLRAGATVLRSEGATTELRSKALAGIYSGQTARVIASFAGPRIREPSRSAELEGYVAKKNIACGINGCAAGDRITIRDGAPSELGSISGTTLRVDPSKPAAGDNAIAVLANGTKVLVTNAGQPDWLKVRLRGVVSASHCDPK
jgi:murein DD-endopeptidase MepM/ murein hydrolase activator NlpD